MFISNDILNFMLYLNEQHCYLCMCGFVCVCVCGLVGR